MRHSMPRAVLKTLCIASWMLLATRPAHADQFSLKAIQTGHLDYVFIGNAMTNNTGLSNGTNCLMPSNSATLSPNMLTAGPTLISATLYVSGSLIEDGVDYPPDIEIFQPPPGLVATTATGQVTADEPAILEVARNSAAVSVQFQPPGASQAVTVSTTSAASYVTVYTVSAGSEAGNVAFFTTPIDVTEVMRQEGQGVIAGTYTVSGLLADVCLGEETVCTTPTSRCATVHTNGNASFALLLVYEDLALPLRSVSVFEGLTELSTQTTSVQLINGNAVSDPASGSLTYYVLEGDLSIGTADPNKTCGGDEYVLVSAAGKNLCLTDADNPPGNIFNGTINTLPPVTPANPNCGAPPEQCCSGPHACGLAGVDIDRYDISAALSPGVTEIDVTVSTGSDRIALADLVLGVDVYQPVLALNSQFRLLNAATQNALQVGAEVTVSLAISNTGNIAADNTQVNMPLPDGIKDFALLASPAGATVGTDGALQATGFSVPPGKISELRFKFTTTCDALGNTINLTAGVSATQVAAFSVQSAPLVIGGPGVGDCVGIDPGGPFATLNPTRVLRGDGCAAAGSSMAGLLGVIPLLAYRRRRSLGLTLTALLTIAACGQRHKDAPATGPHALASLTGLPGTPCGTPLMVQVTNADGSAFCIDRFEASLGESGHVGNTAQSQDDTSITPDGSTTASAVIALDRAPATAVSWYQAKALCENAGKRLCSTSEWERACRGPSSTTYPYGNSAEDTDCNGFFQYHTPNPAPTGSFNTCVSAFGAYDLSGNVEEWLDTAVPRTPGTTTLNDRATHGGSYLSNPDALACVGVEYHSPPNSAAGDRGFRCCHDSP